jgi:hypothetical protein
MSMEVRWQLIRGFEKTLKSDNENMSLRRQLESLTRRNESDKSDMRLQILKLSQTFNETAGTLRRELDQVRADIQHTEKENSVTANRMKSALENIILANQKMTSHRDQLLQENYDLRNTIEEHEKDYKSMHGVKSSENDRLNKLIETLRQDLGESDSKCKDMEERLLMTEAALKNEKGTKETLSEEVKRLRLWIGKMEMNGLKTMEDAEEEKNILIREHESRLQLLLQENAALKDGVEMLNEEVHRLSDLLKTPSTSSHFSKFIALKSENVQLKQNLNAATRKATNAMVMGGPQGGAPHDDPQQQQQRATSGKKGMTKHSRQGSGQGSSRTGPPGVPSYSRHEMTFDLPIEPPTSSGGNREDNSRTVI